VLASSQTFTSASGSTTVPMSRPATTMPPRPTSAPLAEQERGTNLRHPRHRRDDAVHLGRPDRGADVAALHDDPFQPTADARLHGHRRGERRDRGPVRRVDAALDGRPRQRAVEQPGVEEAQPEGRRDRRADGALAG
jgi:hypothetical protein